MVDLESADIGFSFGFSAVLCGSIVVRVVYVSCWKNGSLCHAARNLVLFCGLQCSSPFHAQVWDMDGDTKGIHGMASKLSAAFVRTITKPGKYGDQHGLILRVKPSGSKQWLWRGMIRGKRTDLGLGGWPYVSLAEARQAAFDNRKLARAGGDPLALKRRPDVPTFAEAVERVVAIHEPNWKDGARSADIWRSSLGRYAIPRLGRKRVCDIDTADVLAVLVPIWADKRETARRVRQRIGAVMKWAVAQGYRQDNPAGEAIGAALPKNGVAKSHMKALPYSEVAGAIANIRASARAWRGTKLALEFLVLTAARSGEVRGAQWSEIDLEARTWTVPGSRMKAGKPHRVPLSARALDVLQEAREVADQGGLVFPSVTGRPLSDSTLSKLCRESRVGCVPHGFRSSFRDWCAERSNAPREVCELALAHVNADRVEAAYMRTDLFERRRELMAEWSEYLS